MPTLEDQFGRIDIYLFDQILKGHITPGMRILDAGCGPGRNLVYFLRHGYDVMAVDANPTSVEAVRTLARDIAPTLPESNFQVGSVEHMPFPDASVDVVVCNAVLHFAHDDAHFEAMVHDAWRVLRPGGLFFCRLASTTGVERLVGHLGGNRYRMPDGREWYLVDAVQLEELTDRLGAEWVEPIKTTIVHNLRAMTTWLLRKPA